MNDSGWISVYRKITNSWLWKCKPFAEGQCWIDMIVLANHSDNEFPLGGKTESVNRGSFITSESKLAERWGWSRTRVRTFLKTLEEEEMIQKVSDKFKTTITLVNYDTYQDNLPKKVKPKKQAGKPNKFNDFPQREYSQEHNEELERKLMNMDYFEEGKQ